MTVSPGANQFGAGAGDDFFLSQLMGVAGGKSKLVRLGIDEAGAAVGAPDGAGGFEDIQIAAHGRDRSVDMASQLFEGGELDLLDISFDLVLALFCRHLNVILEDSGRFCNIIVD